MTNGHTVQFEFVLIFIAGLLPPNPKCIVCSEKPQVVVKIDTNRVSVKQFRDDVLVKALNMIEPDVITEGKGLVLISSEEGETDCNNDKKLSELDVIDGCILKVDDFVQQYELTVIIAHKEVEREGDLFEVIADPDSLKPENNAEEKVDDPVEQDNGEPKAKRARREEKDDSDDDLCIIEDGDVDSAPIPTTSSASAGQSSEVQSSERNNKRTIDDDDDDDDDLCIIEDDNMDQDSVPSTSSENRNKRPRFEDDDNDCVVIDSD